MLYDLFIHEDGVLSPPTSIHHELEKKELLNFLAYLVKEGIDFAVGRSL